MGEMPNGYHLLNNQYGAILADPPWTFVTRSNAGKGRSPEQHYDCLDILTLKQMPVGSLARRAGAVLFLWVTDPHLKVGLEVMEAWGFTYKTVAFTWAKENRVGPGWFTGMGYWTRANPEMCLLGTKGVPKRIHKDVRQLIVSKRREHSRKPDEVYPRIERLVPGPYLELFARARRAGWDSWGDQTEFFPAVKKIDTPG